MTRIPKGIDEINRYEPEVNRTWIVQDDLLVCAGEGQLWTVPQPNQEAEKELNNKEFLNTLP